MSRVLSGVPGSKLKAESHARAIATMGTDGRACIESTTSLNLHNKASRGRVGVATTAAAAAATAAVSIDTLTWIFTCSCSDRWQLRANRVRLGCIELQRGDRIAF